MSFPLNRFGIYDVTPFANLPVSEGDYITPPRLGALLRMAPGGRPVLYITHAGNVICPICANNHEQRSGEDVAHAAVNKVLRACVFCGTEMDYELTDTRVSTMIRECDKLPLVKSLAGDLYPHYSARFSQQLVYLTAEQNVFICPDCANGGAPVTSYAINHTPRQCTWCGTKIGD